MLYGFYRLYHLIVKLLCSTSRIFVKLVREMNICLIEKFKANKIVLLNLLYPTIFDLVGHPIWYYFFLTRNSYVVTWVTLAMCLIVLALNNCPRIRLFSSMLWTMFRISTVNHEANIFFPITTYFTNKPDILVPVSNNNWVMGRQSSFKLVTVWVRTVTHSDIMSKFCRLLIRELNLILKPLMLLNLSLSFELIRINF